jgi:hypothetical protein
MRRDIPFALGSVGGGEARSPSGESRAMMNPNGTFVARSLAWQHTHEQFEPQSCPSEQGSGHCEPSAWAVTLVPVTWLSISMYDSVDPNIDPSSERTAKIDMNHAMRAVLRGLGFCPGRRAVISLD